MTVTRDSIVETVAKEIGFSKNNQSIWSRPYLNSSKES
jgi:hypothetical protein